MRTRAAAGASHRPLSHQPLPTMSANQNRDQTGDKNKKTGQIKQHDDVQGGGGGSAGGGGQTKHAEGTQSAAKTASDRERTGSRTDEGSREHAE